MDARSSVELASSPWSGGHSSPPSFCVLPSSLVRTGFVRGRRAAATRRVRSATELLEEGDAQVLLEACAAQGGEGAGDVRVHGLLLQGARIGRDR